MNIKEFEKLILKELDSVINQIIEDNLYLNISARARAGAEISDFLEDKFVEYTKEHTHFKKSESSPKGQTKNPWDVRTLFNLRNISEEIWIDFKAFKLTSADSNPDIGTPNKIINLIKGGSFYLVYTHVYYQPKNSGIEFVKLDDCYTKSYFLKDISHTFRRNPKNQLQVNLSESQEYRTRNNFIKLLIQKLKESHERQINISERQLKELDKIEKELIKKNQESEARLIKNL